MKRPATDWEKHLQRELVLEYIQNCQSLTVRSKQYSQKMGKRHEQTFHQKKYTESKKAHETILTLLTIREM